MYCRAHKGQPPADEAALKSFIKSVSPQDMAAYGITDREGLFVSVRDHEPFVVLYGPEALKGPPGPAGMPVVAFERTGVGGMRFVVSSYGAVESVDEARFKQLVPKAP
jgi:hypothetical protein